MKVLILGGTGAMGTPVTQILAQRGYEVFVTSRKACREDEKNIHYIIGNAQEMGFLFKILKDHYDVIIDFMIYSTEEFRERLELLLRHTKQYIFLSSARVYADQGKIAITEQMPRLLDTIQDKEYVKTDEYALAKAREENLLQKATTKNWTIIRPYITYNDERLQLGALEKENWLQRALQGKAIVFSKDIAARFTTLTYGYDVALRIVDLVGSSEALGQVFHITTEQIVCWQEILELYVDVLTEKLGKTPRVYMMENADLIAKACCNEYQIKYDRLYNRCFNNYKIQEATKEMQPFKETKKGLRKCLENFLDDGHIFCGINWSIEGAFDKVTGDKTSLNEINGWENKLRYFLHRYILSSV